MVNVKCPNCGEQFEIDENARGQSCPACGHTVSAEQNATDAEVRERFRAKKSEITEICKRALEEYEQTGSVKGIHTLIENYVSYRSISWFHDLWSRFILDVTGASAQKKDKELQTYLKNHAKKYDAENPQTGGGLYLSVLQSYPNVGTNNDWDDLIRRTHGDETKFTVLSENIINYIVKSKDKAFAMDIFYLLAAKESEWADAGRIYLRILLSSDEVAAQVFPRSAFNGRTKKFVLNVRAYCRKYLSEGNKITLEETKVWSNYSAACKFHKRRNIGIAAAVLAVMIGAGTGLYFYLDAPAPGSIEFNVDRVIETTYGEPLDLSEYSVSYRKNSGREVELELQTSMLSGFDPELVGKQQTVYLEYAGERLGITILVNAAVLTTPVLTQSGNYVAWDFVPDAAGYNVYVNSTSAPVAQTEELSYDLSTDANYGELTVTVRANAPSDKYTNSAMSEPLTVTKLQAPQNIIYEDGELRWSAVTGADSYEIAINGTPYTSTVNFYSVDLAQGENEVSIVAKSASGTVVDGVARETVTYSKIAAVSQVFYGENRIYWNADGSATAFSLYVDGEYWKDITRDYIDLASDGFTDSFGEGEHTIGIVGRSSLAGVEASEMAEFIVDVGNRIRKEDETLRWNSVGTGATYIVEINGNTHRLSAPYIAVAEAQWNEGENTVSVTANLNNRTIICETATVTKLSAPSVAVAGGEWVTDGDAANRYRFDDGDWGTALPAIDSITAGEHTLEARCVADTSDAFSLVLDSDTALLRIRKLAAPVIFVENGALVCDYDVEEYALKLFYCAEGEDDYTALSSLSGIRSAGIYNLYAVLSATDSLAAQYDYVLDSGQSNAVIVTKLEAPRVFYEQGDERVTSDVPGARFFYMLDGAEQELEDGLISNLPAGTFEIYARQIAAADGELTSENTPQAMRVSVYNMDVTLTVNEVSSSQSQMYVIFGNCTDIDSLTFTYEMKYYDTTGTQIGHKSSAAEMTAEKSGISEENIVTQLNYRLGVQFEQGYEQADIYRVELVVHISGGNGSGGQQLSASMTV